MTRHNSLGALRRCHPSLTNSLNGCAPLSFSPYVSVGIASSQLLNHLHPLPSSRQLHFSPSAPRLSSAPQPKTDSKASPPPTATPQPQPTISPDDPNPPASTRPPPLTLPTRTPSTSTVAHLFHTGKAYLTFYKTGLHQIWTNAKLVRTLPSSPSSTQPPPPEAAESRAASLLRQRTAHDLRRLPLFGLLLLVCGEFTPLVVLLLPQLAPFTCRIPRQVRQLRAAAEERRAAARREEPLVGGGRGDESGEQHPPLLLLARALGVVGQGWDRIGWVPEALAARRVAARWELLARDDAALRRLLRGGDGRAAVARLADEEVELACVDRGIDTVDREVGELRRALGRWLTLTTAASEEETVARMAWLVARGEDEWPQNWPPAGKERV